MRSVFSLFFVILGSAPLCSPNPLRYAINEQIVIDVPSVPKETKKPLNLEPSGEYAFSGITTFHRLPAKNCLKDDGVSDDILIVGMPFDTATSFRSGTRFGPNGIRQGSRAVSLIGAYNFRQKIHPFKNWASVVDCGDFPITPFDNAAGFAQMEEWYKRLLNKEVKSPEFGIKSTKSGKVHPRIIALGGDHSISLPIIRALHSVYGPVSVIHIDAHIDTWSPDVFAGAHGAPSEQARYSDGTPYYYAAAEGLLTNTCVHAGIRSLLDSEQDITTDEKSGFTIIPASDIFESGPAGIAKKIRAAVPHNKPIYLSLDVDSLDPAYAPGTAGPAAGGWTTRELIQIIIDGLADLQIIGADVVEVLPGMDSPGEITSIAAAELTYEVCNAISLDGLYFWESANSGITFAQVISTLVKSQAK